MKNVDLDFFKKEEKKNNLLEKDKTVINNSDETFDILTLDDPETQQKLKRYDLDIDSVKEFRSKIKKVSQNEADNLGIQLLNHLIFSYEDEYIGGVKKSIIDGANIDYEDNFGNTPLLVCIRHNYINAFCTLVRAGADVNKTNKFLENCLIVSAIEGNSEILKILILLNADLTFKNKNGNTVLHLAQQYRNQEYVDLLLQYNSNLINIKNENTEFDILKLTDLETQEKLKEYELDIESIKKFRKQIKKVSKEEADILGEQLCDLLNKKYVDFTVLLKLILDGANVNYCIKQNGSFPLLMWFDKFNNSYFFKFAIELIKAGANINLCNDIMGIRNPHFRNSIRIVFDEINSFMSNENAIKLFDLLLLLKVKITRDDYTYFKNLGTSPIYINQPIYYNKPIYYQLINKILKVYPNLEKNNSKQDANDIINIFSGKGKVDIASPTELLEEVEQKLEEIKRDNIFESIDNQKKKVLK